MIPLTHHEGTESVGVIGPLTLNPDPDGVRGQRHALASFARENLRIPWGNTGGTQDRFRRILAKVKSLAQLGIKLWAIQPIAGIGVDVGISLSWRNNMFA